MKKDVEKAFEECKDSDSSILKAMIKKDKYTDLLTKHNMPTNFSYRKACDIGFKAGRQSMEKEMNK